jgi:hypothetical protein
LVALFVRLTTLTLALPLPPEILNLDEPGRTLRKPVRKK